MSIRTLLASVGVTATLAPLTLFGVAPAEAVLVDDYASVRQWLCSENGAAVDVSWTNAYGGEIKRSNTRLVEGKVSQNGQVMCIYQDAVVGEYGESIWASVTDRSGGYVSCTIFADGVIVAEASDDTPYYSDATCG
ncbi:membrane protein [Gordonia phage Skog]|uniref:Membrane protein n=1 Tax=Gordonia phage Skog TaxID=2704033 RepID=A0A6G6XJH7_9CAUD|nr:membrane protein [Gordonia phage Skog]QIG58248.1 membrane protein [Gordonia phage Skog]